MAKPKWYVGDIHESEICQRCGHVLLQRGDDGIYDLLPCPGCRAHEADTKVEQLCDALSAIIADHDERMRLYPEKENQPHRVHVMEAGRKVLAEAKEWSEAEHV